MWPYYPWRLGPHHTGPPPPPTLGYGTSLYRYNPPRHVQTCALWSMRGYIWNFSPRLRNCYWAFVCFRLTPVYHQCKLAVSPRWQRRNLHCSSAWLLLVVERSSTLDPPETSRRQWDCLWLLDRELSVEEKIGPSGLSCFKDMDIYHVKVAQVVSPKVTLHRFTM